MVGAKFLTVGVDSYRWAKGGGLNDLGGNELELDTLVYINR